MKNVLFALLATLVAACATTTEPVRPPTNIEIQEEVGFTITEEARIGGDVRADYETALSYLQQGRHDEGIALLEQVADAAPELSAPRIDLGIAQHRAGDLEAAEKNLLLALESNPEQPVAHNELGIIYRKTGRFARGPQKLRVRACGLPGFSLRAP